MKELLHALMGKVKPEKMDPMDKKAKMGVLKDIHKMASKDMGEGIKKGMGKVEVASDSPEGLETGLERAHDLIEQAKPEHADKDFNDSDMAHPEEDADDFEDHADENKALDGKGLDEHEKHLGHGEHDEAEEDKENPKMLAPEEEDGDMSDDEIDQMIKHLHSKKKNK